MIWKLKTKISKYKGLLYHLFVFTIFLVFLIIISVLKNETNIIEPLINVQVANTNDLEFDLRAFKLRNKIDTFIWKNINKKIKKENYLSLY
ncbi:MAG: hypothetical protein E7Y34_00800, partial [Mycoplasma sp.]|nr:hypothetical protein [Mycoplasma sp.]